ncbi:MAG: hypothetical protein GY940_27035 [bacterium]|nr:hypothetical protein [bacterium]
MKSKTRFKGFLVLPLFLFMLTFLSTPYVSGAQNPELDEVTRLSALAKVWGLLKYYHPEVAKGQMDWDAVLASAIPGVKAAGDYDSFNQEIDNLIAEAGDVGNDFNAGVPAHPNEKLFKWLKDKTIFSSDVRKKLQTLQKKHVPAANHYFEQKPNYSHITFDNEIRYETLFYPDENYRLISLFRYWNIIQYFFAYKADMDRDWSETLEIFIPRIIDASDEFEYAFVMREFVCQINDSHGIYSSTYWRYWEGYFYAPVELRYIEGKTVVTHVYESLLETPGSIRVGDVILKCRGGQDVDQFRNEWRKFAHGSNESVIQRTLSGYIGRDRSDQLSFNLLRNGQTINTTVKGYYAASIRDAIAAEEAQMDKWKILDGNIGYVNMGIVETTDVDQIMSELMNTKAIIFDIRNYPNGTMYYFTQYLIPEPTEFVLFDLPNPDYPGEFNLGETYTSTWSDNPDYYKGRVVILVDERTQSHAEFNTMSFQTAPDATVIGSQTSGADGNATYVFLPGYAYAYFTNLGVYYPDGSPTQRIGIVPDINVRPTVTGIQTGQDEVLQRAIDFIEN